MKKNKNSGFSLIELIIVIAIMAVLVAIIAPNLTKYLARSKYNTDLHNADELADMIQTCITDYEVNNGQFISSGVNSVTLSWTGRKVSGGPAVFNALLDGMIARDPISEETGTVAKANVSFKGARTEMGYTVTVTIGNASAVK